MHISGNAILDFSSKFFISQKIEDANFATYFPISSEKIEQLEEDFSVELEPQFYTNIETEGTTARVFKKTKKINSFELNYISTSPSAMTHTDGASDENRTRVVSLGS